MLLLSSVTVKAESDQKANIILDVADSHSYLAGRCKNAQRQNHNCRIPGPGRLRIILTFVLIQYFTYTIIDLNKILTHKILFKKSHIFSCNYQNRTFMQTGIIIIEDLKDVADDILIKKEVLPNAVKGVLIEELTLKGNKKIKEKAHANKYDVILVIKGEAIAIAKNRKYSMEAEMITRMPYNEPYSIKPGENGVQLLRLRKTLDTNDVISILKYEEEHSEVFVRAFGECPKYTEDIKSSRSINRMLLPEGMVPRFCMGSVESEGPDSVAEHKHPMLDQLFMGLKDCRCTCYADGKKQLLTENMMLHIPLGAKHSVTVSDDDKLAYIWFDFFLNHDGQRYMSEQHHLDDK